MICHPILHSIALRPQPELRRDIDPSLYAYKKDRVMVLFDQMYDAKHQSYVYKFLTYEVK